MSPPVELQEAYKVYIQTYRLTEFHAFQGLVDPGLTTMRRLLSSSALSFHQLQAVSARIPATVTPEWATLDPRFLKVMAQQCAAYAKLPYSLFKEQRQQVVEAMVARSAFNALPRFAKKQSHHIVDKQLADVFRVKRKIAHFNDPEDPFGALMREYNPELTGEKVDEILDDLTAVCIDVAAKASKDRSKKPLTNRRITEKQGMQLMRQMARQTGIPDDKLKIFSCRSPAALGSPTGVMVANNFNDAALEMIGNGIHENGHAQHKLGLPIDLINSPLGRPLATFHDEGMAFFWEHGVYKSVGGVTYTSAAMQKMDSTSGLWTEANIGSYNQTCNFGTRRLDNCDLGNLLHIIAITRVEKQIIEGKAEPEDYPELWRKEVGRNLGIEIPEDNYDYTLNFQTYSGLIGNFAGYLQGYMAAAQIFRAAEDQIPDLDTRIAAGEWRVIADWLTTNFHSKASRLPACELYLQATGSELNSDALKASLTKRFCT